MIWFFVLGLGGMAAIAVAAWARRSRKRVDAEVEARREQNRLDIQERELLAKLRARQQDKQDGEG
ncbi:MAG: hypothetical protein R3C16_12645 [Hyphomonadaceae bacterium]